MNSEIYDSFLKNTKKLYNLLARFLTLFELSDEQDDLLCALVAEQISTADRGGLADEHGKFADLVDFLEKNRKNADVGYVAYLFLEDVAKQLFNNHDFVCVLCVAILACVALKTNSTAFFKCAKSVECLKTFFAQYEAVTVAAEAALAAGVVASTEEDEVDVAELADKVKELLVQYDKVKSSKKNKKKTAAEVGVV